MPSSRIAPDTRLDRTRLHDETEWLSDLPIIRFALLQQRVLKPGSGIHTMVPTEVGGRGNLRRRLIINPSVRLKLCEIYQVSYSYRVDIETLVELI